MTDREIVSEALKHKDTCFMCRWILADFNANKKLTDWPYDYNNKGDFPRSGKEKHAKLEQGLMV